MKWIKKIWYWLAGKKLVYYVVDKGTVWNGVRLTHRVSQTKYLDTFEEAAAVCDTLIDWDCMPTIKETYIKIK
jgi:hypothetical protein